MTLKHILSVKSFKQKIIFCFFALMLMLNSVTYCQRDWGRGYEDEEDDPMTLKEVGHMLLAGACIAGLGFLLSMLSFTESLGKIIMGIGAFLGIGCVVIYLLQQLFALLAVVVSVGVKLALAGLAVYVVFAILAGIYNWLTGK